MSLKEELLKQELPEILHYRLENVLDEKKHLDEFKLYMHLMNKEHEPLAQLTKLTSEEARMFIDYFHIVRDSEKESNEIMDTLKDTIINAFVESRNVQAISLLYSLTADGNPGECYVIHEEIKRAYWKWREEDERNGVNMNSYYLHNAHKNKEKATILGLTKDEFLDLLETLQTLHKAWMVQYSDPVNFFKNVIKGNVEKENYEPLLRMYHGIPNEGDKFKLFLILEEKELI